MKKLFLVLISFLFLSINLSFSARADGHKINLVVGEWASGPLAPWVEQFTAATGIEVEIQPFPFRELLATIEVRGNAKADDIDVIFVDAPLVPSYAVRGLSLIHI